MLQWVHPFQPGKPGEITIGGHPGAAVFKGQGCEPGVGHQIPSDIGLITQLPEDRPMPGRGSQYPAEWVPPQRVEELEDFVA